ncbi:hypothetical protein ABWI00_06030 [Algihabitans albus]|uniref:hypothetical protein n=1 Tax=Algihabitans albus TaxID=2164067 RepID=UPI0035D0C2DE
MGGRSKSRSSQSTTTTYTTTYDVEDRRIAADGGAVVATEGSIVTIEDLTPALVERALEEAFGFGVEVSEDAFDLSEESIAAIAAASEQSLAAIVSAQDQAFDLTESVLKQTQPQLEGLRSFLTATTVIVGLGALAYYAGRA